MTSDRILYKISEKDSPFIRELYKEINDQTLVGLNSKKFIEKNKLVKYDQTINNSEDLPYQVQYGTVYLIKNNSIIQLCANYNYQNTDIRFSTRTEIWESTVMLHSLSILDINEFTDPIRILDLDGYISNDSTVTISFVTALIRNKFVLYLNP
jgi:hypothetical protein